MSRLLVSDEITDNEANEFIEELIASQILVNQLEPTVTGTDYFEIVLHNLKEIYEINRNEYLEKLLILLNRINQLIGENDKNIINSIDSYRTIQDELKIILPELSEVNLFQTDLYKKTIKNGLGFELQSQLKNAIQFLNKISPATENPNLQEFIKRFYSRYEDYEVPLLIALDIELGLGYPVKENSGVNELVEDIFF